MRKILLLAVVLALSLGAHAAPSATEVFAKASPSIVVIIALDDQKRPIGSGSGVVVERGKVVTNWHVVERASSVSVRRKETNYTASILQDRRDRDLALLSVQGLDAPPVSVSPVRTLAVGQTVYAVGAPAGLELTLTHGLVSALREVDDGKLIQTSAPISPGSSGGGLFNEQGQLVGVTTLKRTGAAMEGLGFAVPADWVVQLVNPDKKTLQKSAWSEWSWFVGIAALVFTLVFGRRILSFAIDRFGEQRQPITEEPSPHTINKTQHDANENATTESSGDSLPSSLLQYARAAREELSQGRPEPSAWKKAETFSNGDPTQAQQLYVRFRASDMEDADAGARAIPLRKQTDNALRHSDTNDSLPHDRNGRKAIVFAAVLVLALILSLPLVTGIIVQRELKSFITTSNVGTKFVVNSIETYNRSWLQSEFETSHKIDGADKSIYVRHSLSHIPTVDHGIKLIIKSQIDSDRSGIVGSQLAPLTRDHLPQATTAIQLRGGYLTEVSVKDLEPAKTNSKGSDVISWRGVSFTISRSGRNSPTSLLLRLGGFSLENPDEKFKLGYSDLEMSLDNSEAIFGDSAAGATWSLSIGGMLSSSPKTGTSKSGLTKIAFKHSRTNDVISGELNGSISDFSVNSLSPPIAYSGTNFVWKLNANRVSASALKNWNRYFLSHDDPRYLPATSAIPQLLKYSPTIDIIDTKLNAQLNQITGEISISANLSFDTNGLNPETSTYDEYVKRTLFSSAISASKKLLLEGLEYSEKTDRIARIAGLEKQRQYFSEADKSAYIQEAKTHSETKIREAIEQGYLIDKSEKVEAQIKYANEKWTINERDLEDLDPELVKEKEQREAIARTRQMSDELRPRPYSDQVKTIVQWRESGNE